MEEDLHLLNEFRARGEPEVLGKLYAGYMHLVYGVCLKYLKDREEANVRGPEESWEARPGFGRPSRPHLNLQILRGASWNRSS